jgi:uncharacterized membrane protein YesL
MKAFTVMWRTIRALYEDLLLWVWLSVLWWIGVFLVLPAGPVTAGIHNAANRVANYRRVESAFFYEGARATIGKSWLLLGINLLMIAGVAVNIRFYGSSDASWAQIVSIVWVWIMIIILMAGQYFFPLLWQQDDMSVKMVLRNAFILALRHPLYTFLMFLFQVLLLVVSFVTVLPIFLLTPAAVVLAMNFSLVGLLQELDLAPEPPPGA